jgi:hypothetical protein
MQTQTDTKQQQKSAGANCASPDNIATVPAESEGKGSA